MAHIIFIQELEFEFLGVMYISAALKKVGHTTGLIFLNRTNEWIDEIKQKKPDVVAASVMTGLHKRIFSAFKLIKQNFPDIITVAGGPHPTFFPDCINNFEIDAVCRGEGEVAFPEFITQLNLDSEKPVNNFIYKTKTGKKIDFSKVNGHISDLDSLPFADREIYYEHKFMLDIPTRAIISSRGCPFKCGYCFNEKYTEIFGKKGYCRLRSQNLIIKEMKEIVSKYPTESFHFMDDTFTMNKKWLFEFLELYRKEIRIPFVCLGTADKIDDEIVENLKHSGCHSIFFGIECGNENYRINILKKPITNKQIIKAAAILKQKKLPFKAFNIVGFPGETLKQSFETLLLNIEIKTDFPWCALFAPYPGTMLADYAVQLGELDRNYSPDDIPQSFHQNSILKNGDIKQIENLHKFFQTAVLFPFLLPVIKLLIKVKNNFLFNYWFGLVYFLVYFRAEKRSFFKTFIFGLKNMQFLVKK